MVAAINRDSVVNALSWMSSTVQATPAKVKEVAGNVWAKVAAFPGAAVHGWQVSRTWMIQTWTSFSLLVAHIYASTAAFFHSVSEKIHQVLAHHVVQSLIQKIKAALVAAWVFVRDLPIREKLLYGSLLVLGLWSGILPWVLKFTLGCTISVAASILHMVFVPLAIVAFCYLAYTRGWFSAAPQVPAAQ